MTDFICFAAILLFEFGIFYFLPVLNGRGTVFGLILSDADYANEGLPIIRNFRRDLSFLLITTFIVLFLLLKFSPQSLGFAYIFATAFILGLLVKYLRKGWRLRDKRVVGRLAASLKPRRLKDFSNLCLEIGVIFLTVSPLLIVSSYYGQLPESIPVHWNFAGVADRWEQKSFFSVFFPSLLTIWLQIFWIILKQDIIQARFRVPAGENAVQILSLKEISLQANVSLIDWCRLMGGLLLAAVSLLILTAAEVNFPFASAINILLWTSLVSMVGGIAFFIYRMILVNREIKSITGRITFQTANEMAGWDAGGLYYYNPKDAAFMVEKPGGVGYTLNFAHKRTLLYLALLLSPTLIAFIEIFLTKNQ